MHLHSNCFRTFLPFEGQYCGRNRGINTQWTSLPPLSVKTTTEHSFLNEGCTRVVWLPGTNASFRFKERTSTATLLNLSQLHPKIPICWAINFQHPSNGNICQGCPNCFWPLLTCAMQAARNVALCLLHNCLSSWAQVSRAHGGRATHQHIQQACCGSGPRRGRRGSLSLET